MFLAPPWKTTAHVEVEGNEQEDREAAKGAKASHGCVLKYK